MNYFVEQMHQATTEENKARILAAYPWRKIRRNELYKKTTVKETLSL